MNPLITLWQFSLWFLGICVAIVCAPFSLVLSLPVGLTIAAARSRAIRRHNRHSWSYHRPGQRRRSGYQRARHGIFS